MFDPCSAVRFRGPITPHVEGFWSTLMQAGYSKQSATKLLFVAAHVSGSGCPRPRGRWSGSASSSLTADVAGIEHF